MAVSAPNFAADDETARAHVTRRRNIMLAYKQPFTLRNNEHSRAYRGYLEPRSYPLSTQLRSNIHVPYSFASVEQMTSRLTKAVLGNPGTEYFEMMAWGATPPRTAVAHKKVLMMQWEFMNGFMQFYALLKSCVMFGYAAAKIDWILQERKRRFLRLKDEWIGQAISEALRKQYGRGLYEEAEEEITEYEGNRLVAIDWDHIYIDPAACYTLHTGRDCLQVVKTTLRDLKAQKLPDGTSKYKNLDHIAPHPSYSQEDSDQDRRMATIGASKNVHNKPYSQFDPEGEIVELWEYWTDMWTITIANSSTTIASKANPFWHFKKPFIDINYTYVPNELFGIGCIESFRDLQKALNIITNMDLDNWSLLINQMFCVSRDANVAHEQLVSRPSGVIYVDGDVRQALAPVQRTSIAGETQGKISTVRADISLANGIADWHYMGQNSNSRIGTTATGMREASEESTYRTECSVSLIECMGVKPMLEMMISNNNQFVTTPQWVQQVKDAPPEQVLPENIWGEFRLRLFGSSRVGRRDAKQFNFNNALRTLANMPMLMDQFRPRAIAKLLVDLYEIGDPDDLLSPGPGEILAPEREHEMMLHGAEVEPTPEEQLYMHFQAHIVFMNGPIYATWPDDAKDRLAMHVKRTGEFIQMLEGAKSGVEPAMGNMTNSVAAQGREAAGVGANAADASGGGEFTSSTEESRI